MIKDKIEKDCIWQKDNIFDVEPYNYIFHGRTAFLDSDIIVKNASKLQHILENFAKINPLLLDLLAHPQQYHIKDKYGKCKVQNVTALSKAIEAGNSRTINILLKYLAKCSHDSSTTHKALFPRLLEFTSFVDYVGSLPI